MGLGELHYPRFCASVFGVDADASLGRPELFNPKVFIVGEVLLSPLGLGGGVAPRPWGCIPYFCPAAFPCWPPKRLRNCAGFLPFMLPSPTSILFPSGWGSQPSQTFLGDQQTRYLPGRYHLPRFQ